MKKLLSIILSTFILICVLSACSGARISQNNDITPTPENSVENVIMPSPEISTKEEVPTNTNQGISQANFIGEEKAKNIALQKAGISIDGVNFERIELDSENGIWHYEVDLKKDNIEYDVEIKADDGKIISFEKDIDD